MTPPNLTRAEIMSAAPEQLRLWVAEYVDGWRWFPGLDGYEFFRREMEFNYGVVRKDGVVTASYLGNIPDYPADIAAAWKVLEKITKHPCQTDEEIASKRAFVFWFRKSDLWAQPEKEAAKQICQNALIAVTGAE